MEVAKKVLNSAICGFKRLLASLEMTILIIFLMPDNQAKAKLLTLNF